MLLGVAQALMCLPDYVYTQVKFEAIKEEYAYVAYGCAAPCGDKELCAHTFVDPRDLTCYFGFLQEHVDAVYEWY